MKKRILSMLLAIMMVVSLLPTAALAQEGESNPQGATHTHCVCGATPHIAVGNHKDKDEKIWTAINNAEELLAISGENGCYYLASDIQLTKNWQPKNGTKLCLNGHDITFTSGCIYLRYTSEFTLTDCEPNGDVGKITGGRGESSKGGGVYVRDCEFTMFGGKITGNKANTGSGVWLRENSTTKFYLYGGEILGNSVDTDPYGAGGDVYFPTNAYFEIAGSPVIGVLLFPSADNQITIGEGGLSEGASIGVSTSQSKINIAQTNRANDSQYFHSQKAGYDIQYVGGQIRLAKVEKLTVTFIVDQNGDSLKRQVDPNSTMAAPTLAEVAGELMPGYTLEGWCADRYTLKNAWNFANDEVTQDMILYAKLKLDSPEVQTGVGYTGIYDAQTHNISISASHEAYDNMANYFTYQWYRDGKDESNKVDGATGMNCYVKNVADSGVYYCKVTATDSKFIHSPEKLALISEAWSDGITVAISKQEVTSPTIEDKVFTGEALTADVPESALYTVTSNDGGSLVGEYDVVLTLTDSSNYTWPGSDSPNLTLKFNILNADQYAPAAPTTQSIGAYSVKLNTVSGCEYSKDGTNWQASPEFNDLTPGTAYTFYQRLAAKDNYNASPASAVLDVTTLNIYTVTYADGVADVEVFADQTTENVIHGTATPAFSGTPTRTGYTFAGWTPSVAETVTTNVTYTANWSINQYTITFNTDDGSEIEAITQDYNTAVTAPADPTKAGYTFAGWKTEAGKDFTFSNYKMGAESFTLTAKWNPADGTAYTVNHHFQNIENDEYTAETESKSGVTEAQTAAEAKTVTGFTAGEVTQKAIKADGSTVINIYYTRNKHTLTFKPENGESDIVSEVKFGAPITAPAAPNKTGFTFNGWGEVAATMPAENVTVTAQWTPITYIVIFNANNGTEDTTEQSFTYDSAAELNANAFEYDGYSFLGWAAAADGEAVYGNCHSILNLTAENGDEIELFAVWSANPVISGVITEAYGEPTVILRGLDGTEYEASVISSGDGYIYSVSAPVGTYQLVVQAVVNDGDAHNVTVTYAEELAEDIVQDIEIPHENKNSSVVEIVDGAPEAIVDGLDDIAANVGETGVTIKLTVTAETADSNDAEQTAIRTEARGKTLEFVDLTLTKNGSDIGDTNTQLLTIVVPFEKGNKLNITVYRYHGTQAEKLNENPADGSEGFVVGTDSITIYAKKFSAYAIGYTVPYYPTTYSVVVEDTVNGTVKANPNYATSGSTVSVTVTPDKGYVLDKLTVTDIFGTEVDVAVKDGKYTFKMPAAKVTVKATFKEEVAFQNPFEDVFTTDYYYDAVLWAVKEGITNGTSVTTFSPNAPCTRAQMVTFLWRAAGSPEPTATTCPFTDVDMDSFYGKAVLWAVENGITNGTSDTTFSPDMECSRAQMATFLYRMAGGKAKSDTIAFTDVKADAYYAESVQWAVENGITNGTGDNKFSPDATCTRAQMVTFLYRYYVK